MSSRGRAEIRWLHVSDFHLRVDLEWSQDVVLRALLEDIAARYSGVQAPDLIFITGDIAFSGRPEEYGLAEIFIRQLQEITAVSPERLFIIPGNHDVDRSIEEDAFRGAREHLSDELEVDRFFNNEARRRTLFRRQAAFRNFVNRIAPPSSPYSETSFAHWKHAGVGPVQVVVLLLDSAWLAEGGDADAGRLLVGERQVMDAYTSTPRPALAFGLAHHPFAWLKDFEQMAIENLLLDRVNIMLRGHVHAVDLRALEALERRLTFFTAGASFENRTSNNSYGFATLDLLHGQGLSILHRYVHAQQRWQATEPQQWRLLDSAQPQVPLAQALELFERDGRPYATYKAFLLAGYTTEVPRPIGGRCVLLNSHVDIPGDPNPLGKTISALRHLLHWRTAWEERDWEEELASLLFEFHQTLERLAGLSPEIAGQIAARDRQCKDTAGSFVSSAGSLQASLIDNLIHLEAAGEFDAILSLIDRSRHAGILTLDERRSVEAIEIVALLELNRPGEASARITALLKNEPADAELLCLAARCYYAARDFATAAKHMHEALDAGASVERSRRLALLIAGQSADARLAERVRQHEQ